MGDRLKHLKKRSNGEQQEMLALFSASNNAILTFQERQWKATNYGLLLLAGVFASSKLLLELGGSFFTVGCIRLLAHALFFIFAGLLATVFTWHVLDELEKAITNARHTADTAIFALSPRFREANYPEGFPSDNERTTLLTLFRVVLLSGFFILILALFFSASRI